MAQAALSSNDLRAARLAPVAAPHIWQANEVIAVDDVTDGMAHDARADRLRARGCFGGVVTMALTEQERAEVMRRVLKDDHVQAIERLRAAAHHVAALAIQHTATERCD